jgi:hypothetical protein
MYKIYFLYVGGKDLVRWVLRLWREEMTSRYGGKL